MRSTKLLALVVAAGLVLAACGDDDESPAATGDDATTTTAGDEAAPTGATVQVATNDELGEYLVDAEGRTLYLFEQDQGTTTACTGGCADNWPPLVAESPTGGDGIDADELSTADGIEPNQVTYHGHLLYYFAGDAAPGDTNGTSVPAWYAVDASGEAIELD